jgi:Ca2+-binding EF-hand superfamily protein
LDLLSLSIAYRFRDPVAEAEQNARDVFNLIDMDANGYLDRAEVAEHQRFERYLFDAMDADGDGRVFAEEMMAYVRAHAEPATTSCQVTLFDIGNGYFQLLDLNGDGRISIRELRLVEQTLLQIAGGEAEINPSRSSKAYRIEIRRGGVTLFGKVDRPEADLPTALLTPPAGPMWFQRMDRNGDGDLTWDEFLGPRDVFDRIDRDGDGLIDAVEAAMFSE